jgi:hypothetical protein
MLPQPTPPAALKRLPPSSPDAELQPLPSRALPTAVWEDHLLPLLTCKDAARLGCTGKALRGVVREHFKSLSTVGVSEVRGALTTFPRARTVIIEDGQWNMWRDQAEEDLVQCLREGRGRHLEVITLGELYQSRSDLLHKALQAGALPSLKIVHADLPDEVSRASLTQGLLGGMHDLRLRLAMCKNRGAQLSKERKPQLAALGLVRGLPALSRLELQLQGGSSTPAQWPPFMPPTLKALRIDVSACGTVGESLLAALSGMLEASGATLERLEIHIHTSFESIGDGLVHVAEAVRCCSPNLTGCLLATDHSRPLYIERGAADNAETRERLRVQWGGVLAALSTCRQLETLVLPSVPTEPLFPPGTAFARLTHLEISDYEREHPPSAGAMGLWELMASGGLPALARLYVPLEGRWMGAEEVKARVAPALEAVAGTLTHLCLEKSIKPDEPSVEVEVEYEFGVAVGKLRRLKDIVLGLGEDGWTYHGFGQGLAASAGDRPLPLLWRVTLSSMIKPSCAVQVVDSLVLPSVRVLAGYCYCDRSAFLMACALRQAGYNHIWAFACGYLDAKDKIRAIVPCHLSVFGRHTGTAGWCVGRL